MFDLGFPPYWSTLKKLIWLVGSGVVGGAKWTTLTGAIVSFFAKKSAPINALSVTLEPQQDLHGQDAPYPGGGGKNKLINPTLAHLQEINTDGTWSNNEYTINGVKYTVNGDGTYSVSGTASAQADFYIAGTFSTSEDILPSTGNYLVNGGTTNAFLRIVGFGVTSFNVNMSDVQLNATSTEGKVIIRVIAGNTVDVTLKPMIRPSSISDSTYAPFENICPITGWTGAKVWVKDTYDTTLPSTLSVTFPALGKNLTPTDVTVGLNISSSGAEETNTAASTSGYISVQSDTTYTFNIATTIVGVRVEMYDEQKTFISRTETANKTHTFTTTSVTKYIRWTLNYNATPMATTQEVVDSLTPQLELGSSATSYEPYTNTVYGGTLDFVSGVLTGKYAKKHLVANDFTSFYVAYKQAYSTTDLLADKPAYYQSDAITYLSDTFKPIANINRATGTGNFATLIGNGYNVAFSANVSSIEEFKALIPNGIDFVYQLATPLTYQLTPQQINTLVGQNNIWSDSGDVTVQVPSNIIVT